MILDGLRVIDAASYLAAPAAATVMADFGAEVIKVEPPGGDGYRLLHGVHRTDYNWQLTSRNKRDICLDLHDPEGRAVLLKLIDSADVLLLNFREEQLKSFELDYAALRERNPRLIYALLTGFGTAGPDREKRGFDVTGWWARTGIMDLAKPHDQAPLFPPGGVGDHATSMSLLSGIMMALYDRERTGLGRQVSTSLAASGCFANGMHLQGAIAGFDLSKVLAERGGKRGPFTSVYGTRDGEWIVLVITNPAKEWPLLAECLGHSEWCADPRFIDLSAIMQNRDDLRELLMREIGSRNLSDLCVAMDAANLPYAPVDRLGDVIGDAHLIENGVLVKTESDHPDYQWTVANPITISDAPHVTPRMAPEKGEHSREILSEAGYTEAEIDRLVGADVVRAEQGER